MNATPTVAACESARFDQDAVTVPVTDLRVTDLVWDRTGRLHRLDAVEPGLDGTVWLRRHDLPAAEHLSGRITVHRSPDVRR